MIEFNDTRLADAITAYKVYCWFKTPVTTMSDLQKACGSNKYSALCTFDFIAKKGTNFRLIYKVATLSSSRLTKAKIHQSKWSLVIPAASKWDTLSKKQALAQFGFSVDDFFKSNVFIEYLPKIKSYASRGVDQLADMIKTAKDLRAQSTLDVMRCSLIEAINVIDKKYFDDVPKFLPDPDRNGKLGMPTHATDKHRNNDDIDAIVDDIVNEGFGKSLATGLAAATMSFGGMSALASQADNDNQSKSYSALAVKKNYSKDQTINIVARTIYDEARGESSDGKKAIMSVIWNRAGGDVNKLANVCLCKKQFSGWNRDTPWTNPKFSPDNYTSVDPDNMKGQKDKDAWAECQRLARTAVNSGQFTSNIGNSNMIINPKLDNATALNTWGDESNRTYHIGNHYFGYDKSQDGFKHNVKKQSTPMVAAKRIYVVKKGDNLAKIAKNNNMSLKDLLAKNPRIINPNKIFIGQKLFI